LTPCMVSGPTSHPDTQSSARLYRRPHDGTALRNRGAARRYAIGPGLCCSGGGDEGGVRTKLTEAKQWRVVRQTHPTSAHAGTHARRTFVIHRTIRHCICSPGCGRALQRIGQLCDHGRVTCHQWSVNPASPLEVVAWTVPVYHGVGRAVHARHSDVKTHGRVRERHEPPARRSVCSRRRIHGACRADEAVVASRRAESASESSGGRRERGWPCYGPQDGCAHAGSGRRPYTSREEGSGDRGRCGGEQLRRPAQTRTVASHARRGPGRGADGRRRHEQGAKRSRRSLREHGSHSDGAIPTPLRVCRTSNWCTGCTVPPVPIAAPPAWRASLLLGGSSESTAPPRWAINPTARGCGGVWQFDCPPHRRNAAGMAFRGCHVGDRNAKAGCIGGGSVRVCLQQRRLAAVVYDGCAPPSHGH